MTIPLKFVKIQKFNNTNHIGNNILINLSIEIRNIAVNEDVYPNWNRGSICRKHGRIGTNCCPALKKTVIENQLLI